MTVAGVAAIGSEQELPIRVLVAEDVAVNRELIRLMLKADRYRVETVCDGAAALEAVKAADYDLVLMDMQMPGVDGLQATRAIRALGGRAATLPIIALSANIIPDQVRRCLDAGMTAHLPKPFTAKDLCAAVEAWGRPARKTNAVLEAFVQQAGWASVRGLLDMMLTQLAEFEACPPGDTGALARNAHALRGAAGALGFTDLASVCREVEESARHGALSAPIVHLAFKATAITRGEILDELRRAA